MRALSDVESRPSVEVILQVLSTRGEVAELGRHDIVTVKVEEGEARVVFKESSAITSMSGADGYIEIPANCDLVDKGELVEVTYL